MRRPVFAASLTVLLLVAVLRYELTVQAKHVIVAARPAVTPPTGARSAAARRAQHVRPTRSRTAAATRGTPARASRGQGSPAPSSRSTSRSASPAPAGPTGTYTGTPSGTPYGIVQVRIKVANGRISDVVALQMPNSSPRSSELSAQAGPQLRGEALAAQSAKIDDVSGATYTSEGYKQSLQAAIDQAHL